MRIILVLVLISIAQSIDVTSYNTPFKQEGILEARQLLQNKVAALSQPSKVLNMVINTPKPDQATQIRMITYLLTVVENDFTLLNNMADIDSLNSLFMRYLNIAPIVQATAASVPFNTDILCKAQEFIIYNVNKVELINRLFSLKTQLRPGKPFDFGRSMPKEAIEFVFRALDGEFNESMNDVLFTALTYIIGMISNMRGMAPFEFSLHPIISDCAVLQLPHEDNSIASAYVASEMIQLSNTNIFCLLRIQINYLSYDDIETEKRDDQRQA